MKEIEASWKDLKGYMVFNVGPTILTHQLLEEDYDLLKLLTREYDSMVNEVNISTMDEKKLKNIHRKFTLFVEEIRNKRNARR